MTELFIENQRADISTALSSLLTLAIDDIKDFSSRQTSFSKTIVLPGSANNNKILGSIFEISTRNDYDAYLPNTGINFNASASANCIIFQDFLQVFKGTLRILQINLDRGRIEYEVSVVGNLSQLNVRLSSGLLEQLDFSAYDVVYNETNIVNSWDNTPGSGVYFPLLDYGTYSINKHDWDFHTFRPALYVKEYIDKMFAAAGFRYSSALFDTTRFKKLIVPHNTKQLTVITTHLLSASRETGDETVIDSGGSTTERFSFDTYNTTIFTPDDSDPQRFTYNGADPITTVLSWNLNYHWKATNNFITLELKKNGVAIASKTLNNTSGFTVPGFWNSSVSISLATNDYFEFWATVSDSSAGHDYALVFNSGSISDDLSIAIPVPVGLGDTIKINDTIPKNIRQIDFLVSIVKLFNLYVYEDKFDENLMYITPYVDFYSTASQNADDWTYKLDRNKPVTIKPMSEINAKLYNFNYASDSDYYNDLYQKRYNQTYGSYIYDTLFEFIDQTQTVDLIFASTPLIGYSGEDKVYPTIFKLSNSTEETVDSVIRIMQTKKVTGVTSWNILNGVSVLTSVTDYGYAGHFDDPDNVANDLNFGVLQELFFILVSGDLTVTQFNVYWSPYMAEITDKDSKLLTGMFYLTPKDILNLDFSKYKVVDGNLFRLNKITDYNLNMPDTCSVELLKVINTVY